MSARRDAREEDEDELRMGVLTLFQSRIVKKTHVKSQAPQEMATNLAVNERGGGGCRETATGLNGGRERWNLRSPR